MVTKRSCVVGLAVCLSLTVVILLIVCQGEQEPGYDGIIAWAEENGMAIDHWQAGHWHHVAATWDTDWLHVYLDGKLSGRQKQKGQISEGEDQRILCVMC